MAAALVAMVARLSLPPAGPEPEATYLEIIDRCAELADALIAGGDEDTQAFAAVMAAYRMPKSTDVEKQARSPAIQAALAHATRVPLRNAELCAGVLAQVARLEGRSNRNAASDLQCAAYLARAGLQGCLANVEINLPGIKDPGVTAEIRARAQTLTIPG